MAAVLSPARFLVENEGQHVEGRWSHVLCSLLGFEVEAPRTPASPVVGPPIVEEAPRAPVPLVELPAVAAPEQPLAVLDLPALPETQAPPEAHVPPDELSFLSVSLARWLETTPMRKST